MNLTDLVTEKRHELFRKSRAYLASFMRITESICEDRTLARIVCYGIGKISESTISRHQLALLEILAKQLDIQAVDIWDPLITEEEWQYYSSINYNKAGFPIKARALTLFYMPHCDLDVYDQLLSFQGHASLPNVILFGNNLANYSLRDPARLRGTFISKLEHDTECIDSTLHDRHDVFNDCSFMYNFRLTSGPI